MDVVLILEDLGYAVLEAPNAICAIKHMESRDDVGILFTDIQMSGDIDGIALANEVDRRWPGVSIIVYSGRFSPEANVLPDRARFISKPCNPSLVASTVFAMRGIVVG